MPEIAHKKGWSLVTFGDVVKLSRVRTSNPEADGFKRYVGLEHIEPGDLKIRRWGDIADGTTFTSVFQPGQVLFGKRRAYQRKIAVADFSGVCSGDIYVFEPRNSHLLPELLPFICEADGFFEYAIGTSAGSLSPRTNWNSLASYEFGLPPLEEQGRIVAACLAARDLSEHYRDLAICASALLRGCIDALAETFTDAVMSVGALVEDEVLYDPQDGNHGGKHPTASDYIAEGIPFLMAADIRGGRVDLAGCHFLPASLAGNLRTGFAQEGDVLLTHKGTLGQTAILKGLQTDYAMLTPQVTYYRVLDKSKLLHEYLYYAFQAPDFQRQMIAHGRQSTRSYVGITKQRDLTLPLPPLSVQQALVEQCRSIEHGSQFALRRADESARMTGAIMQHAFSDSKAS